MQHSRNWSVRTAIRVLAVVTTTLGLSGCLITSPYWAQIFDDRSEAIPVQAWSGNRNAEATVSCANPSNWRWREVQRLSPQPAGVLDPNGVRIFSISAEVVVPEVCWQRDGVAAAPYLTLLKVSQPGSTRVPEFGVVERRGLECLGQSIGRAASWTGWSGADCLRMIPGSDELTRYLALRARS